MSDNNPFTLFRNLHRPGQPLVLFNVWDVGSALAVAQSGAAALATGSWSVAAANGYPDGEKMPRAEAIAVLRAIVRATTLPVSVDLESGYGDLADLEQTVALAIEAGAVGCNLEDSYPHEGSLRGMADAAARIAAARRVAERMRPGFFVNARCDVFFQAPAGRHDSAMAAAVLERGRAYAEAGADGLFAPGVTDLALVRELAAGSPLPLNVMRGSDTPSIADLAKAGVSRVSHGPHPYRVAMEALTALVRASEGR
jgi:methylisocitrate lyase